MTTTRRDFLKVIGASSGAVAFACPMAGCGTTEARDINVGNVDDFDDGLTLVDGEGLIIGRDGDGLYAMTAICTHAACDMSAGNGDIQADGITCTCHSSVYDLDGKNTGGPAGAPLDHFAVEIAEDGAVTVKVGSVVAAGERAEIT